MKTWRISNRLNLLIGVSVLVMVMLLVLNWVTLSHLGELQQEVYKRTQDAGQMRHDSGLGAQAYRIVADTFINREFDDAAKNWQTMSAEIDQALNHAAKVADTDQERAWVQTASQAITDIRKAYAEGYLPLAKRDAPQSEIAEIDGKIDKLIDVYDNNMNKAATSLLAEADLAAKAFDAASRTSQRVAAVSVVMGGLLLVGLALLVSRSITSQLGMEPSHASALAHHIAAGDLSHEFPPGSNMQDNLAGALNDMLGTLKTIVTKVRQGSEAVASASTEIAQGNHDLSARTEQQASALEQTAASMEQLGATVKQNADSAIKNNTFFIVFMIHAPFKISKISFSYLIRPISLEIA